MPKPYPSTLFDYGESLIVKNYEELKMRFENWKKDPRKFNKNIINESHKYFPIDKSKNKIYDLLHVYLESKIKYYF